MLARFLKLRPLLAMPRVRSQAFRAMSKMVPPSQYDIPMTVLLANPIRCCIEHYELWPILIICVYKVIFVLIAVAYFCVHKVDVSFTPKNRNEICRTMDLRHPTIHKMFTINQRYDPWPEMQDVLDAMKNAENQRKERASLC